MSIVIEISNLYKEYRLGVIGHGTLTRDLQSWWARLRGKEDPNSLIALLEGQEQQVEGDRFWALRNINVEVKEGEILGIIGKNGAGKSTLLKLLSRVTAPSRGFIKIKGRIASLLEVGTGFHPELTGRENIFMNGVILGMSRQEIKIKMDEIVDFYGFEKYLDTPVKRYSSGMRVRLGFSVAAHLDPEILVIDEVLAVGDAEFQKKCLGKMNEVSKTGRTVLFVSHNMVSIQNLCTRGILLEHGMVCMDGDTESIISRYLVEEQLGNEGIYSRGRKPNGKIVYIQAARLIVNEKPTEIILSGQKVSFEIDYCAVQEGFPCKMFIGIYNHLGEKILHLGTPFGNLEEFPSQDNGKIVATILKFPLTSGRYTVNFSLHLNGKPHDRVQGAMSFLVGEGDFYCNGHIPSAKESKFLVHQDWFIN